MSIIRKQRVFLDTWVLRTLAKDPLSTQVGRIKRMIDAGPWRVVVTADHVFDFCSGTDQKAALADASFVTSCLKPLWMLNGLSIYELEAYREYCRLTATVAPGQPVPCEDLREVLQQICWNTPLQSDMAVLPRDSGAVSFYDMVQMWYVLDAFQQQCMTDVLKGKFGNNRAWARAKGVNWDAYALDVWTKQALEWAGVAYNPAADWHRLNLQNMPAWRMRLEVDKVWHRNPSRPAKTGDFADMNHLALLHYVDAFVTEKDLANMVRETGLDEYEGRVFRNVAAWLAAIDNTKPESQCF